MEQQEQWNSCSYNFTSVCIYTRVYVRRNFRILLFHCSSCSINRGILYVYNREGVIIIFLHFPLEKFGNSTILLYLCSRFWEVSNFLQKKPKISLTELHRLYVKKVLLHLVIPRRSGRNSALIVRVLSVYCA